MKKISLSAIICLLLAFSLIGCSSSLEKGSVSLGDYSKIEVVKADIEITDEDVESYIQSILKEKSTTSTLTEGLVETGDTIDISYIGYIDGEAFEGGSAENTFITVGQSGYIDGFDDGLIGASVGSSVDLNLTFPDPYTNNEELSGKPVLFEVTVNSKSVMVTPELTDGWVSENYSALGLTTEDEFKGYSRKLLEDSVMGNAIWSKILAESKVESYNLVELDSLVNEQREYYESQISGSYGMTLEDYLSLSGSNEEEFTKNMSDSIKNFLQQKMTVNAIASKENIVVTEEEMDTELQKYAGSYGYESVEDLKKEFPKSNLDQLELQLLVEKVTNLLKDNVVFVEAKEEVTTPVE